MRRHNLGTVLRHVHGAGHISRAELTTLMGLNRSTIAGLLTELGSLGITQRAVPVGAPSGAGRPSAGVRLVKDGPYVIAVDLGVDRAVVAGVAPGRQGPRIGRRRRSTAVARRGRSAPRSPA